MERMTNRQLPPGTMRAWRTHEYGPRPTEVLKLDAVSIPEPQAGEVRVRVQAIPLNLNDLERITGGNMRVRPELPYSPGMEVMGVVEACGDGADGWQNKRVVAMPRGANGGFAEHAVCPLVSAFEMPDEIPLPDAAALYFPFHLAWLGLFDRAELKGGESVLIHAAAGGSGSAAVQLAVHAGARVFATASSDEKLQLCRDLGADVTINYKEQDFAQIVLDQTGDRGVDVVFDNVGQAVMEKSMSCLAYNGRYLMMGFASEGGRRREADRSAAGRDRQLQALRRAARLPAGRDGKDAEAGHGLELCLGPAGRTDHARDRRAGARQEGEAGDRQGGRVRGHPCGDRSHGEPRDRGPDDRDALAPGN